MHLAVMTIELHIPGCHSLKQKRSQLKPLLIRLHREFNVSAAEIDYHDVLQSAVIACAAVSTDAAHLQRLLKPIPGWIERTRPDLQTVDHYVDLY
jgi:uncharacterized protein YlxP (DUF503 family)